MSASTVLETVQQAKSVRIDRGTRIGQIDVLRGLSILAVVFFHINLRLRLSETPIGEKLPKVLLTGILGNGHNGVIIFFAVSGFLITTTCMRRWGSLAQISLRQFYFLRFARIAPMLLALLVVLSGLHLLHIRFFTLDPQRSSLPRALFAALTFHVNWLESRHGYLPANWDVLWSLSNEEVFYLGLPFLCRLVKNRLGIVLMLLTFVVLGPFARTVLTHNEIWADKGYLSCMDAIAIGCLAALCADKIVLGTGGRIAVLGLGWFLIALVTLFRAQARSLVLFDSGLNVTVLAAGTALIAVASVHARSQGSCFSAPIRWFGRNSYEVYLTHMMVIFALLPLATRLDGDRHWVLGSSVLMVAATGVIGWCIARYYSEPMNRRLRGRIRSSSV